MPAVDPFPTTLPSSADPVNFDPRADAYYVHLPTFVEQLNALIASVSAAATPVAITIPYRADLSATTDADPGAGKIRFNSATQNLSTVLRADLADANGQAVTSILDALDDSTSTLKGFLRLTAIGDGTKWLLFTVSAVASPSGYRNITVAPIASSAANPFADDDEISLTFVRNGDKGDTGPTGSSLAWVQLSSQTVSGTPSAVTFTGISSAYSDLQFELTSLTYSMAATLQVSLSQDGVTFSSAVEITSTTGLVDAVVDVPGYRLDYGAISGAGRTGTLPNGDLVATSISIANPLVWRRDGGITAVRFTPSVGTFTGGTFKLRGK